MKLHRILILPLLAILVGCSTTGGTLGGLLPMPKFLKGKIDNNIYYSKDSTFEIRTPFEQGSYSYSYMEVKEKYNNAGAYVSFNTSTHPGEFYRVEAAKKLDRSRPSPPLDQIVASILLFYTKQLARYGSGAKELWRTTTTFDGKKAVLVTLAQSASSKYQSSPSGHTVYHILYIVESPNGGGVVSVQWPDACGACLSGPEKDILATNIRIKSFIESFRLKI